MESLELFVTVEALGLDLQGIVANILISMIRFLVGRNWYIFLPNPTCNVAWLRICYIGNAQFFSRERSYVVIDLPSCILDLESCIKLI